MEFNEVVRLSYFKMEIDDDNQMSKIRWQTWVLLNPHLKTKISDPKKLYKLLSEIKHEQGESIELEEMARNIDWDNLNNL